MYRQSHYPYKLPRLRAPAPAFFQAPLPHVFGAAAPKGKLTENNCFPMAAKMNIMIPNMAVRLAKDPRVETMMDKRTRIVFHDCASLKTRICNMG